MIEGGMGGLMGITWFEDRDQPCHLGTHLRTLTEGTEVYTNGDFNHCAGNPGNRKEVGFGTTRGISCAGSRSARARRATRSG